MDLKVKVVSRQQWGAAEPKDKENLTSPAGKIVIHHTALPSCTGLDECKARVASIQREHMSKKGFDDIGYNFLVGGDGTVYEGRGWGVVGAHARGHNHDSLGIAFMGNFNNEAPSKEAIKSVKELLQAGVSEAFIAPGFGLFGHRDLGSTECPGEKLYAAIPQLKGT
ncbi:peptidoglycan recognition protein 5 [Acanthochromis polyacanthus]|uniref:Peptidoglycan recognition protein 5 n=1 Tax=Acanthochromis polyacanthus TaxID=80966 RepID=A0A3Q1FTM1_9TELE|nr:peptidoglycan recognition protein 5 [Acanthochromis polyacanthus]